MSTSEFAILADASSSNGGLTVTLPAASNTGMLVFIKKIDNSTQTVIIKSAGTDTIEGASTQSLTTKNQSRTLIAGGNHVWYIQSAT